MKKQKIFVKRKMKTQLYRHWDKEGGLLYVGISLSAVARLSQHSNHSGWYSDIDKVTIETFDDRESAINAEIKAIRSENPKYNIQNKNSGNSKFEKEEAERARQKIINRTVNFKITYTIQEAGNFLNVGPSTIKRLMDEGMLSYFDISPNGSSKKMIRISGWQLIDYLESVSYCEK